MKLGSSLKHFGCEGDDFHEFFRAQFSRDRAENAGADGLKLIVKQHRRVPVKPNDRTIGTTNALFGSNDYSVVDFAFFDTPPWDGILDADLDDVADVCIPAMRTAQHLDAHNRSCSALAGDIQVALHLNHRQY